MLDLVTLNINNQPTTTSKIIADTFGKPHKDVLKAVRTLELPQDFNRRNFSPTSYQDRLGRNCPAYEITRDGFTLLAMGFTGKKAMEFKIKYINAFNQMEEKLKAAHPYGEVAVREHTRALPSGKKEIVLSDKAKSEIGEIVKACLSGVSFGGRDDEKFAELIAAKVAANMMYIKMDEMHMKADEHRRQAEVYQAAASAFRKSLLRIEGAIVR